jgi:ketosteroid isomerase-like protein
MEAVGDEVVAEVAFTMEGAGSGVNLEVPSYAAILLEEGKIRSYRVFADREDAVRAAEAGAP